MAKRLSPADLKDLVKVHKSVRRQRKKEKTSEVASSTSAVADETVSSAAEPEIAELSPRSGAIVVYSGIPSEAEMCQGSATEEGRSEDLPLPLPTGGGMGASSSLPFEGEGGDILPAQQSRTEEISPLPQVDAQREEIPPTLEPSVSRVEEEEDQVREPSVCYASKPRSLEGILSLVEIDELDRRDKKRRRDAKKSNKASFPFLYAPKPSIPASAASVGAGWAFGSSLAVTGGEGAQHVLDGNPCPEGSTGTVRSAERVGPLVNPAPRFATIPSAPGSSSQRRGVGGEHRSIGIMTEDSDADYYRDEAYEMLKDKVDGLHQQLDRKEISLSGAESDLRKEVEKNEFLIRELSTKDDVIQAFIGQMEELRIELKEARGENSALKQDLGGVYSRVRYLERQRSFDRGYPGQRGHYSDRGQCSEDRSARPPIDIRAAEGSRKRPREDVARSSPGADSARRSPSEFQGWPAVERIRVGGTRDQAEEVERYRLRLKKAELKVQARTTQVTRLKGQCNDHLRTMADEAYVAGFNLCRDKAMQLGSPAEVGALECPPVRGNRAVLTALGDLLRNITSLGAIEEEGEDEDAEKE